MALQWTDFQKCLKKMDQAKEIKAELVISGELVAGWRVIFIVRKDRQSLIKLIGDF